MSSDTVLRLQLDETAVEFSTDRAELRSAIACIYRAFVVGDQNHPLPSLNSVPQGGPWRASVDGREFVDPEFDAALQVIEDAVADRLLTAVSDCLLLHAAAVSDEQTNILIVGPSGSGKTTTALELVRRGMRYITDEFTAIEPGGTVIRPFPRSATRKFDGPTPNGANLKIPHGRTYRTHMLPDNRSALTAHPVQSYKIIFPRHRNDVTPVARMLTSAEVCAFLMPSIFDFEGREEELWPTLADVVIRSRACELIYNDAMNDLDLALDMLG